MQLTYADFTITIFEDVNYDSQSAGNVIEYDHYYALEDPQQLRLFQRGIRLIGEDGQTIQQICIAASGGNTGVHEHSYVLFEERLAVCCGDSIFCLVVPDLTLLWQAQADWATCFDVFAYESDLIVHGELAISRLDKEGAFAWQFFARDIFVNLTIEDTFRIVGNVVFATDWDGTVYEIDASTGALLTEHKTQENQMLREVVKRKMLLTYGQFRSFFSRLSSFF